MRRGIAADAPLSDAGEERLSEEDRRALKMIEELFPGEYRAAKREVAAAIASEGYRTECVSAIICFPQVETYKSRR